LTVHRGCVLSPTPVRAGAGSEAASEESPESQISIAEAIRIGNEAVGIRLGFVIEGDSGIQRQALIGLAEAGEQRIYLRRRARVRLICLQRCSSSIEVA
jgi:hypothetical protein